MRRTLPILLILAIAASACEVRIDQGTFFAEDGSGRVVLDVLLDEELRNLTGFDDAASAFDVAGGMPEGFEVEDLVEGDFAGARATSAFDDIDGLNTILEDAAGGSGVAEDLSATREGNEYRYSGTVGDLGAAVDSAGIGGLTTATFDQFFVVSVSVRLPGEVIDHNADEVLEDGTLVWNLGIDDSGSTIQATSRVATDWAPIAIGAIVVAAVLGAAAVWFLRRKRVSGDVEESSLGNEGPVGSTM